MNKFGVIVLSTVLAASNIVAPVSTYAASSKENSYEAKQLAKQQKQKEKEEAQKKKQEEKAKKQKEKEEKQNKEQTAKLEKQKEKQQKLMNQVGLMKSSNHMLHLIKTFMLKMENYT